MLKSTVTHPFRVVNRGDFVLAHEIQAGDILEGPAGELLSVLRNDDEFHEDGIAVYNLSIDGAHTYFAASGADGLPVLTHNQNGDCAGGKNKSTSSNSSIPETKYNQAFGVKTPGSTPRTIQIDARKAGDSSKHLEDSGSVGIPLQVNRPGAPQNRKDALRGKAKVPGYNLDEAPPAVLRKPGDPVSVRPVISDDNRSAGAQLGNGLRGVSNNDFVIIEIVNKPK